jgi:hypothetical protein
VTGTGYPHRKARSGQFDIGRGSLIGREIGQLICPLAHGRGPSMMLAYAAAVLAGVPEVVHPSGVQLGWTR